MANHRVSRLHAAGMALALAALVPVAASAQENTDPRLLPWLGCWQPVNAAGAGGDLLCVQPATGQDAVEVVRISGNEIVSREVVWADGQRHATERSGCEGWDEGTFSEDGRRLFVDSEHACTSGPTERGAGIMAMSSPEEWLDVRVAGRGDDLTAWVQRYRVAAAETAQAAGFGDVLGDQSWNVRSARMVASAALDVDDVIEASSAVPNQAVEAFLAERGSQLRLDSHEVVRMADAGVAESTIDVAVAVSYPETFQVAKGAPPERSALDEGIESGRWGYRGYGYYDPYFYDPFYRYGYGYGYGFGYSGYGGYYGGYGYVPTVIVVDRQQPVEHGRFVAGRGYTRGSRGSTGATRSSGGPPRASSGSTGSRSPGAAAGSRGSSTGRTAKPRGGRGGR